MPILTHEERVGTLLAEKYRLASILGRGGMGAVFAGRHEWTGRGVAVKLLNHDLASDPQMAERFLREARTAAELKHPNVVDVLDMGRADDGCVYLVLELLDGASLSDHLGAGPLEPATAFALLTPVMRALAHAHRRGVIHRDLKPDNIFVSEDTDGRTVPKLLDFGIAKVIEQDGTSMTRTGMLLGTPDYMSPEQARALPDIGPATDVWSMGVVWYECLTGNLPFNEASPSALVITIATTHAPSIALRRPDLHPALVAAIDRSLASDRSQRFPDMRAFLEAMIEAATLAGIATSDRASIDSTVHLPAPQSVRRNTALSNLPTSIAEPTTTGAEAAVPLTARATKQVGDPKVATRMSWSGAAPTQREAPVRKMNVIAIVGGIVAVAALTAGGLALMKSRSSATTHAATTTPAVPSPVVPAQSAVPSPPVANPLQAVTAPTIVAAPPSVEVAPSAMTAPSTHGRPAAPTTHAGAHDPIAIVPIVNPPPTAATPVAPSQPVVAAQPEPVRATTNSPVVAQPPANPPTPRHSNPPAHPTNAGANTPLTDYE